MLRSDDVVAPAPERRAVALDVPVVAMRFGRAGIEEMRTEIPVETPVEIGFGGLPFAVMMMTPADLADFALGFCLTEGVIATRSDIRRLSVEEIGDAIRLDVELSPDRMSGHLSRRRAISGRTGCGVCGIQDLAHVERSLVPVARRVPVDIAAVRRALAGLESLQVVNARTHAVHAAAWSGRDGVVTHLREDVGRHNALDKLIGALLADEVDPAGGFVVITSRCSFEMVDKAAAFGAGLVVAISAPTSLALARAEWLGVELVGIARQDGLIAFTSGAIAADRDCAA